MTVTRQGFSMVVDNAFAGLGFAADAAKTVFPIPMFLPGSDLTPIERGIDEIIAGLTKWEPKLKAKKVTVPRKIRVAGRDYEDAVTSMNNLFLKNLWSDGLPIRPATEERVSWILTGTDLSPDTVIGKILPRGGIATVQAMAISLAMAGGRPEYLPVLIAVVEAIIDPQFRHFHMNATTCSSYPAVIVNGPIAKQIRLNSGYGCLGPSSAYPAGASIGRAIRFILMNVGGGVPGIGSMAIYGGPARYTGLVFAEDEDGIPAGWEPLNVERGFPKGSNTVTVHSISGTANICSASTTTEDVALETLDRFAGFMRAPNDNLFTMPHTPDGAPGILLIGRGSARGLADLGWSKEKVKTYLWEHTFLSESEMPRRVLEKRARDGWMAKELVRSPTPIAVSPKNIMIVVAGGAQSGHAYWMEVGCCPYAPVSAAVKLPANWKKLLEAAADDLGPPPSSA